MSIFLWNQQPGRGFSTAPIFVPLTDTWQTLVWDIPWPLEFDKSNVDQVKVIVHGLQGNPTGWIRLDNIMGSTPPPTPTPTPSPTHTHTPTPIYVYLPLLMKAHVQEQMGQLSPRKTRRLRVGIYYTHTKENGSCSPYHVQEWKG